MVAFCSVSVVGVKKSRAVVIHFTLWVSLEHGTSIQPNWLGVSYYYLYTLAKAHSTADVGFATQTHLLYYSYIFSFRLFTWLQT